MDWQKLVSKTQKLCSENATSQVKTFIVAYLSFITCPAMAVPCQLASYSLFLKKQILCCPNCQLVITTKPTRSKRAPATLSNRWPIKAKILHLVPLSLLALPSRFKMQSLKNGISVLLSQLFENVDNLTVQNKTMEKTAFVAACCFGHALLESKETNERS